MGRIFAIVLMICMFLISAGGNGNDKYANSAAGEVVSEKDLMNSEKEIELLEDLIGRSATELNQEDIELLLQTPVLTLCEIFDYPVPTIYNCWMMGCTVSSDKLRGLVMNAGYDMDGNTDISADALPASFYIFNNEESALAGNDAIPLGYSFEDIMALPDWGSTDIETVLYPGGYSGDGAVPIERISYKKGAIQYSFTIDYNWVFTSSEQHELSADLVTLTLNR